MRRRIMAVAMSSALTLVGCTSAADPQTVATGADAAVDDPSPADDAVAAEAALERCDAVEMISAPAERYRDRPRYVGNEMPVEEVLAWASDQPGFEDLWIDREHNGWISVAFSTDADSRQVEIEQIFPDDGVVAVAVDYHMADLIDLQQRIMTELPAQEWGVSSGVQPQHGVVTVGIGVLSDDRLELVAGLFGDAPICVEGADPADVIPEGPQPLGGDGWRLLADELGGWSYRTGIAASDAELGTLLDEIGLESIATPDVDFEIEVVIWFGVPYSGSCPDIRLDDVIVEGENSLVYAEIVAPGPQPSECTADANPRTYLVAVERSRLPEAPFTIQIGAEVPAGVAVEERTVVSGDVRSPGAALGPGDVGADPRPAAPSRPQVLETGIPTDFDFDLVCGARQLGRFNDFWWQVDGADPADRSVPAEWGVTPGAIVGVQLVLLPGPDPTLTATFRGHSVVYHPSNEPLPCN